MKRVGVFCTAVLFFAAAGPLLAGPLGAGISLQAGTLGFGVEVVKRVLPALNVRVGGNFFSYGIDQTNDTYDIRYDASLRLQTFSLLCDWHGLPGGFFLSGGVQLNQNRLEASGVSTVSYEYYGRVYTPEELGDLKVVVDFAKVSPYLGIGWGNPAGRPGRLGFVFNLGALYHRSPQVDLIANGMITPTAEQEPEIEADLKELRFYPVLSFGLTYGF